MMNDKSKISNANLYLIDFGLLIVALSWGASYSLMQLITQSGMSVPMFLMLRFSLSVPFMLLYLKSIRNFNFSEITNGILFGLLLYIILTLETNGVKYTTASNAGFLIVVSVILLPLIERVFAKKRQSIWVYFAGILSVFGCALLCFGQTGNINLNIGDLLILMAALVRSFQIFLFARQTSGKNLSLINITLIELIVVSLLGLIHVLWIEPSVFHKIENVQFEIWLYIIFLSFFATAFAFLMQLYAAKWTSATRVGLILSLEPLFAAIFAVMIVNDVLGWTQILGGGIILIAALIGRWAERIKYESS